MYTIYQGYAFPISIVSDVEIDVANSRIFSPLSKCFITLSPLFSSVDEKGNFLYQALIDEEETRKLTQGSYNLELRTPNGYMAKHIEGFARVEDSALIYID